MKKFSFKSISFFASSAILAIGSGIAPAQTQSVINSFDSANDLDTEPIEIATATPPTADAIAVQELLPNLTLLSQTTSDTEQISPNEGTTVPAQPGQPLETVPAPPSSGTNLPSPLDPTPTTPERSDTPDRSVESEQDTLPPGSDINPPGTEDTSPPGTQTPGSPLPQSRPKLP